MTLLDDVKAEIRGSGSSCTVGAVLTALPTDEAADLTVILADPSIPGSAIARALGRRGHSVGQSALNRHRRGDCCCERPSR